MVMVSNEFLSLSCVFDGVRLTWEDMSFVGVVRMRCSVRSPVVNTFSR